MFNNVYRGKKVLVTGHTGFKGSWLCFWLLKMGAKICGFSLDIPTNPSNFEILGLKEQIKHIFGDIRDRNHLLETIQNFNPDFIFHLAAQALVRRSYNDPAYTFETNALGTLNVLECMRLCSSVKVGVIITSDKCYRNLEWTWGYRENDLLGGEDPYSSSKGCAELVIYSYNHSFFKNGPRIASTRAGNVLGGGDWAEDRIVPDAIRAWSQGAPVIIRDPKATRPWQHVLEPLSGYLWLGVKLWQNNPSIVGEAFNFGPASIVNQSVEEVISNIAKYWSGASWEVKKSNRENKPESSLLKLCCDKAMNLINWLPILSFSETMRMTSEWYYSYYKNKDYSMHGKTESQLEYYFKKAKEKGLEWTK